MTIEPGTTYIRKLSALDPERDAVSRRLRLERILSASDWRSSGLPEQSILCIRRLQDPLPGGLSLHAAAWHPSARWNEALCSVLTQMVRTAERPALSSTPTNAQAVLFADRAELLACLARDWCEGSVASRWWWQGLFKGTDLTAAVQHAWMETPPYAPAALQWLAEWGLAAPFLRTWDSFHVEVLWSNVTQSFALRELQPSLLLTLAEPETAMSNRISDDQEANSGSSRTMQHTPRTSPLIPPWTQWAPETRDSGLRLDQQLFLAIGLMLHRAPNVVRSLPFVESVRHWVQTALLSPVFGNEDAVGNPVPSMIAAPAEVLSYKPSGPASVLPATSPPQETVVGESLENDRLRAVRTTVTEEPSQIGGDETVRKVLDTPVMTPEAVFRAPDSTGTFIHQAFGGEQLPSMESLYSPEARNLEPMKALMRRGTSDIETVFGGVFYLVNLGLFLELYGDFTNPLRPGIALPLWDFVALVGRELVGKQLEDDPVWILLANLAGRADDEEPGESFVPPEQMWEMVSGSSGLSPLTLGGSQSEFSSLRSVIPVQAGLQEFHAEVTGHPAWIPAFAGMTNRQPIYQNQNDTIPIFSSRISNELTYWLKGLMPYIRERLRRALGSTVHDDLGAVLCYHRARVMATPTHVDVYLSLADLPVAIRLAGLDRDPGWVPAAGRYIAFYFD